MAADIFIKIKDIAGESQDDKHKGEIDVESWSWGASNIGSSQSGGGGGTGKVSFSDLSFVHFVDKASNALLLHCANGKHIGEALLTQRKAGEDQQEFLKIKLTDVLVSSVQQGDSRGGERPTESVSLNFAKVEFEYCEQKKDGTLDAAAKMGWDLKANKKV